MPGIDLSGIDAVRRESVASDDALRDATVRVRDLRLDLSDRLARGADPADITDLTAALAEAQAGRDAILQERTRLIDAVRERADAIVEAVGNPERAIATLDGRTPIALLPVRIETKYASPDRLLVRVFPDQLHVTAHDEALTDAEIDAGQRYWQLRWERLDDATVAADAWNTMVAGFRPGRARFVVDTMRPTNSPPDPPAYPDPARRAEGWSRPPMARALPDRVAVIGHRRDGEGRYTEIFRVWGGASIPDTLAVGPSPAALTQAEDGYPDDPALAWLRDPAAAERVGLLITVTQDDIHPGTGARLGDGVDRILVCGLDWTRTPEQSAAELQSLLVAQHAEGDMSFVPAGTPTNNTADTDAGAGAGSATDPRAYDPFEPTDPVPDGAARTLAAALGLRPETLDAVPHAGLREPRWQSALAEVLWRAGPGHYLTDLLDPVASSPQIDARMREFAVAHLRPGGPIPTIRSGRQPYGILPIVARRRFAPHGPAERDVLKVATVLRDLAEPLVGQVPRLPEAGTSAAVDEALLALLQRTPVAWSLDFRSAVGPVQRKAMSVYWDMIAAFQRDWTAIIWSKLQTYTLTRLSELTLDKQSHRLDVPLVRPTVDGRATGDPAVYLAEIAELLTDPHGELVLRLRENSEALLEALVACSAVAEIAAVAATVVKPVVGDPAEVRDVFTLPKVADTFRIETPVADAQLKLATASMRELAEAVVPQVDPTQPVAVAVTSQFAAKWFDRIAELGVPTDPHYWMGRFATALKDLAQAPADELEWAFRGQLDAYASRMDAWFTALASSRLADHRAARPTGVHVGCWGWVEDLRPEGRGDRTLGYVHTPSIPQATTAALLRSARQGHEGPGGEVFDVQLTSARAKEALAVLGGVGQGQRLTALLGYRIERRLQDAGPLITRYIWHFRAAYPLHSQGDNPDQPAQAIAARDVVDGVALLDAWRADRAAVLTAGRVAPGDAGAVSGVLDAVAGIYDGVSDGLVAEAVHQAAQGNLERAGAALGAHDRQSAPPDLDVLRTPRDGAVLVQRVGVLLQDDGPAPGWPRDIRGRAEPRLDTWLGTVLGPPAGWAVTARLLRADGSVEDLPPITLDQVGLGPLSLVRAAVRPGVGGPSELEGLIALVLRATAPALGPGDRIELLPEGAPGDPARGIALLLTLLEAAGKVVGSQSVSGPDFAASGATAGAGATVDAAELRSRVSQVRTSLTTALDGPSGLRAAIAGGAAADLFHALLTASVFDSTALPVDVPMSVDAATSLSAQAETVLTALTAAAARFDTEFAAVAATGDPVEVDGLIAAVRILLGPGAPMLPVLTLSDAAAATASLADRAALLSGDDFAVVTWLHQRALVRPHVDPLGMLLRHNEADNVDVAGELRVVQAPHAPGTRWCALPLADLSAPPAHGTAALVCHAPTAPDLSRPIAGLLVDSWTETLPSATATTALAYHVDAPGSRPPQTVLLAVHPQVDPSTWDLDTVLDTIAEAADLARLRTLTMKELSVLGGFLPAWYLPDCYTRDVASVPLKGLRERAFATGFAKIATIAGKG